VEPLPHQITAVYQEMLPRQPLRFLLADDPGAGKTIMTGLLIRELMARGDLARCLVGAATRSASRSRSSGAGSVATLEVEARVPTGLTDQFQKRVTQNGRDPQRRGRLRV